MTWTVRTEDGSLEFQSLGEIERAYRNGLVAPGDEIREPGSEVWRRADAFPALRRTAAARPASMSANTKLSIVLSIALAVSALWFLAQGYWIVALVLALGLSVYLMRLTARAVAPKRTMIRV